MAESVLGIVTLLFIATIAAIVFKRINFPYTIGLVVVGIVFSRICAHTGMQGIQNIRLTPELILYVLLPALIFEASVNIDSRMLLKNLGPVFALAAPGLIISTAITGIMMYFLSPLDIGGAMLFGALISATDPVAVISLFEIVGAPRRLRILVDGESLFNDATAIVTFNIIKGIILSGAAFSAMTLVSGTVQFMITFCGGLLIGAVIGFIMIQIVSWAKNDPLVEISFSTIVAYTAFIVADHFFNTSGVMSVMGAGIVISYFGSSRFTPNVKQYMQQFWAFMSFVANSFIFLLLGFTEEFELLDGKHYSGILLYVLWAVLAIQIARAVIIFGIVPLFGLRRKPDKIDFGYKFIMFWGGLRGAVPLALVFSLPAELPHRQMIIEITLGTVLFTLLIQGTTIKRLLHFFKLDNPTLYNQIAKLEAMLAARKSGLDNLAGLKSKKLLDPEIISQFEAQYNEKQRVLMTQIKELSQAPDFLKTAARQVVWTRALAKAERCYTDCYLNGYIPESIYRKLIFRVEMQQDKLISSEKIQSKIEFEPIDLRVENMLFKWAIKLLPGNRLLKRYQAWLTTNDYLCATCICLAAFQVMNEMEKINARRPVLSEAVTECHDAFKELYNTAEKTLGLLSEENPELMRLIDKAFVNEIIHNAEITTVSEMNENSELPNIVAEELIDEIQKKIRLSRVAIYSDNH